MKPALISDFNPGDRIAKSFSNYREVEARIVGDKVSFSVLIDEGLKICRLDQLLPPEQWFGQPEQPDHEKPPVALKSHWNGRLHD